MGTIRDLLLNMFLDLNFNIEISSLITSLVMIVIWILIGIFSIVLVKQVLFKLLRVKSRGARALTIGRLVSSISKYLIWFIILLLILTELEIDVTPFIASAGMFGLIIGFGAQEVVRDFISGFFIIFEESFNVGDMIRVDGFSGVVLDLGLRTTRIVNWKDEVKIIRNGDIGSLINFSKEDSVAVIDFGVSYNTDLVKFPKLMEKFIKSIDGKYDDIIEKPIFLGVIKLDDSSINMRVIAKTVAVKHFQIERDIRADLVIFCSSNKIEIPFPQLVIHNE